MRDLDVRRDGVKQHRPVALGRVALEAQQGARSLRCEREHLRRLRDRLGKLELTGIDALEIRMPPGARSRPALGRRAERFQMDIFDPRFGQRRR